jgi:hypothetical protein
MLINFEEITTDLTPEELEWLELMVIGLRKYTAQNPIKAPDIVAGWNSKPGRLKMTEVKLRKFCNHIRANGILPLIATSKGYFVSWDKEDIRNQVTSLEQRSRSIQSSADGLKRFL